MNDRYLFKAKRKNWKELPKEEWWVQGHYVKIDSISCVYALQNEEPAQRIHQIDESTLCQCTGLKDKDGMLIWENDITKCQDVVGKVGWNETHLAFTILANVNRNMQYYYINELLGEEIEVIGSIFDNPELLEVGK